MPDLTVQDILQAARLVDMCESIDEVAELKRAFDEPLPKLSDDPVIRCKQLLQLLVRRTRQGQRLIELFVGG